MSGVAELCWGDGCGALLELNGGGGGVAWVVCWDVAYGLGCELCKSLSGDEDGLVREVSIVGVEGCGWS